MAVATTLLAAVSCNVTEEEPATPAGQLTINLDSGFLQTRAADVSFEGVIDHFDFFFFTDAEGTTPVAGMHGRVTGSTTTLDATKSGDYYALRHITSYVYILANYPGELSHSTDWTLAQLLALPLDHPLAKRVTVVNPETEAVEETDEIEFCDYLVMDSYDAANNTYTTEIAPQTFNETRTVTIGLSRIAAKLTMEITVPESVSAGGEVWTPVVKDIQAYYVNALNNKSTVAASPVQRSLLTSETGYEYMTYPTSYPLTRKEGTAIVFDTDPVYTYPQEWTMGENGEAYFKIAMPWNGSLHGTSNFYYKVTAPKPVDGKITLNRNSWYKISVTLSVLESEEEYVEVEEYGFTVSPWAGGIDGGSPLSSAQFFNVPVKSYTLYSQDSIMVPFSSSSAVSAYFTEISYTHYRVGSGVTYTFPYTAADNVSSVTLPATYGGEEISPESAKDKNAYTLTVEGKNVKFKHALSNIYTERTVKFVIKNEEGSTATITVKQHPAIEITTHLSRNVFVNGHFARTSEGVHVNGSTQKMGVPYTLQHSDYEEGETRYHSDDNRRPDGTSYNDVGPDSEGKYHYWFPGNSSTSEQSYAVVISDPTRGRYGWIEGEQKNAPYLIEIGVSAFNEDNKSYSYTYFSSPTATGSPHSKTFVLGDPRVKGGNRFSGLVNYLYKSSTLRDANGGTTVEAPEYRAWEQPMDILIASTAKEDGAIIAPRFIVSSFLNAQPGGLTFEECLKRAATYQEAGYPAGRWRLPTEAEIMFMVQQQQNLVIPALWGVGSSYWCADGRYVTVGGSGASTVSFYNPASSATRQVNRFVYDTWYWGEAPMSDDETYWPNMHLVAPNN